MPFLRTTSPSRTVARLGVKANRLLLRHPTGRWVTLGGAVGVLCGMAGAVFQVGADALSTLLLEHVAGLPPLIAASHQASSFHEPHAFHPFILLAVLFAGGCTAGLIIQRWAMAAKGGGTGTAVDAFHHRRGAIPLSVPLTKLVASVVTLGSGGSGGREGPISLMGAGFASWFAGVLRLSVRDRRILLAAGIAGGLAAVFRAPLASAIFAAEVLYRGPELEADVIVPAFIAAVVGYLVGSFGLDLLGPLLGQPGAISSTMFQPPPLTFQASDWQQLGGYAAVAIAVVLVSRWFMWAQGHIGRSFDELRLPFWLKPGLGAALAGALAIGLYASATLVVPQTDDAQIALATIGGGYGVLHWLFGAQPAAHAPLILAGLLAALAAAKVLATALTVGSGGSAGLFGPGLVIGGCVGGAVGALLHGLPIAPPLPACVLMGMAGVLAATHRTPIAALLMVAEIAGTWLLLMPAMWVCGLTVLLVGRGSLVGGQVERMQDSPAHRNHLFTDVLADATVADVLDVHQDWGAMPPQTTLADCRLIAQGRHQDVFPVVAADGRFLGIIDRSELALTQADSAMDGFVLAADLVSGAGLAVLPSDTLAQVMRRLQQQHLDELPVVDAGGRFLGMISNGQVMTCYRNRIDTLDAERQREERRATR
jgi:CIC family chloride channel protein